MKLIRLQLNTPFRSLSEGFTINFLHEKDKSKAYDFNPWCMAGRNGAGKSNILEAVAAIFYHLECIYLDFKPDGFEKNSENRTGFEPSVSRPDAYELSYFITCPPGLTSAAIHPSMTSTLVQIQIIKEEGSRPIVYLFDEKEGKLKGLSRVDIKELLPEYIIGYSSGENEILSLPFLKMRFIHFDEYKERLIDEKGYNKPEARFVFADSSYSQAIFLANYLIQDEAVLDPFLDVLGIEKLDRFRIVIRDKQFIKSEGEEVTGYVRMEATGGIDIPIKKNKSEMILQFINTLHYKT